MGNLTSIESKDVPAANPSQEVLQLTKLDKIVDAIDGLATEKAALNRLVICVINDSQNRGKRNTTLLFIHISRR